MFKKVVRVVRQEGVLSLLRKSWLTLLWGLVRGEAVFMKKTEAGCSLPQRAGVDVRKATLADCELFASYLPEYLRACERRFGSGETAFIACVNNEVAYIMWCRRINSLSFSFVDRDEIPVPEKSLYIYDCFTLPEYRRQGIYPFMLDHVVHYYPGGSCYIACQCHTERSIKGIVKAGFMLCWKFYWFKKGPINIKWQRNYL